MQPSNVNARSAIAFICNLGLSASVQCQNGAFSRQAVQGAFWKQFNKTKLLEDMRFTNNMLASLSTVVLGAILGLGFIGEARAEDKKVDAAGTWSWVIKGPDRKTTAKLKVDGDKVTGTVSAPNRNGESRDTEIQDGKLKGDELSFNVTREINGNKMITKYTGKISGDTIKGKMEFERNGEPVNRDWEATRGTDAK
jgi:hypothetical protein